MKRITKKPWFGPKRYGLGISPKSWQGWLITFDFAAFLIIIGYYWPDINFWVGFIITILALAILFTTMILMHGSEK